MRPRTTPLTKAERANFETLNRVYDGGDIALVRTRLAKDLKAGTEVAMLAAVVSDDDEVAITPFAIFLPGNPYELLEDPTLD